MTRRILNLTRRVPVSVRADRAMEADLSSVRVPVIQTHSSAYHADSESQSASTLPASLAPSMFLAQCRPGAPARGMVASLSAGPAIFSSDRPCLARPVRAGRPGTFR